MRVLVACEFSGVVREAFRALGHDAWSCDLREASDGSPFHIQGDALQAVSLGWDLLIAHPPCTFLSVSSVWALKDPDFERFPGVGYHQKVCAGTLTGPSRREALAQSVEFVQALWDAPIRHKCFENPVGMLSSLWRKPSQVVQPYEFGDDASKKTCLWLDGLPVLTPLGRFPGRMVEWPKGSGRLIERWGNQTDSGQSNVPPSDDRAALRAVTYPGIANAMASQWSAFIGGQ